jgi:hypothetical protein
MKIQRIKLVNDKRFYTCFYCGHLIKSDQSVCLICGAGIVWAKEGKDEIGNNINDK